MGVSITMMEISLKTVWKMGFCHSDRNNEVNGGKNGVIGGPFIFLNKTSEIRVGKMVHTY